LWTRLSAAQRLLNVLLLIAILAFVHPQIALMGLIWLMGVAIHYLPRLPMEIPFVLRWSIPAAVLVCAATLIWCKGTRFTLADYILGITVSSLIYAVLSCSRTSMPSAYNWTADACRTPLTPCTWCMFHSWFSSTLGSGRHDGFLLQVTC
jgi:hypothetical protein